MNFKFYQWARAVGCTLVGFSSAGVVNADVAPTDKDNALILLANNEVFNEDDLVFGNEFSTEVEGGDSSSRKNNKLLFGGNRKFTYQHDLAYIFTDPSEIGSNRSSLRFQWNKVVWEKLYLNIDVKPIAYLNGDDALNSGDTFDSVLKTKELYGSLTLGNTSITVGEKIIVWGESESSPVTDIISPQNIQDLVFTSLDESRISQTMLVVEQYLGNSEFSLIVNPNIKTDEQPTMGQVDLPSEMEDKNAEVGFRWKAAIGRGDFSLMMADVVDNSDVPVYTADGRAEKIFYKGYTMIGAAANLNLGDIALQVESAYNIDRAQSLDESTFDAAIHPDGYGKSDELLVSVNMDFQESGLRDWSAGILHSETLGYSDTFSFKEKRTNEIFLGVTNKFHHELIDVSLEYQYKIETEESIAHLMLSYRAADNLSFSIDFINLDNIEGSFDQSSSIARIIYNF